jgi:uncharacterized protein YegJ (DUF2314 family)
MLLRSLRIAFAIAVLAASGVALASSAANAQAARPKDKVVDFSRDDAEMNQAIRKARDSLGDFWKAYTSPGPGEVDFLLKVAIPYSSSANEHFWLKDISRDGSRLVGTIDNDPNRATHVKRGERYTFEESSVSDWMYRRNGKIVGAETLRVMLPRMPKQQADSFRAQLEKP